MVAGPGHIAEVAVLERAESMQIELPEVPHPPYENLPWNADNWDVIISHKKNSCLT